MMEKDEINKIEAFVNNQMTTTEKAAFKARFKSNPELEEAVKLHILERETVWLFAEKDLRSNLKKWKAAIEEKEDDEQETTAAQPVPPKKTAQIRPLRRYLSIAASVLLLVTAGTFWWANANFSNSNLIEQQYIVADFPGDKGGTSTFDEQYETGLMNFSNQNYQTTIDGLKTIPSDTKEYLAAQYLIGHSQYLLKNYKTAIPHFKMVLAQEARPSFINKDKLQWDLLLAYVGNEQFDADYKTLMTEIQKNGKAPYRQKAIDLETSLSSFWRKIVF